MSSGWKGGRNHVVARYIGAEVLDDINDTDLTRPSLLIRVRDRSNNEAWREFFGIYGPLLYNYARAQGLSHPDAEDVRSLCYEALVKQIPTFEYDRRKGGFKSWLLTMVSRRVIDLLRKPKQLQFTSAVLRALPDEPTPIDDVWEREWRQQHLRYCVQSLKTDVSETTWEIFRMLITEGQGIPDVCRKLNVTTNQAYKARTRMLAMVRKKMEYLDPSSIAPNVSNPTAPSTKPVDHHQARQ